VHEWYCHSGRNLEGWVAPAALAGAAQLRATVNSSCWDIAFVLKEPFHKNHVWHAE
jgi:hypothetical protein